MSSDGTARSVAFGYLRRPIGYFCPVTWNVIRLVARVVAGGLPTLPAMADQLAHLVGSSRIPRQGIGSFYRKALGFIGSNLSVIAFYHPVDVVLDRWVCSPALLLHQIDQGGALVCAVVTRRQLLDGSV